MVVAASTGNRKPLECFADRIDLVIDHGNLFALNIDGSLVELYEPIETQADERFIESQSVVPTGCDQIASKMLLDESVDRHIFTKCTYQVVAAPVSKWQLGIVL